MEEGELNTEHTHTLPSTLQEPRENRAEKWASSISSPCDTAVVFSPEGKWTEISRLIAHNKGLLTLYRIRTIAIGLFVIKCHVTVYRLKFLA